MNTSFLELDKHKINIKALLGLMLVAYLFSCFMRFIWIQENTNNPEFRWNNEVMINTNDGYFYAQGAKDILNNTKLYEYSPVETPTSQLTAILTKILPFSLDTIILYMPVFLSSLLIIPMIMIGYVLKIPYLGFVSSLIASITWSYYNRTMAGYYDTDMLIVVFPTLVLFSLIASISTKQYRYVLILILSVLAYKMWHAGGNVYNIALSGFFFLYIVAFERKNLFLYKVLSILLIVSSNIDITYAFILSLSLVGIFKYSKIENDKIIWGVLFFSILLFLYFGGLSAVFGQLQSYVFRALVADPMPSLKFYGVVNTVREAGQIPFSLFATRISGSESLFFLGSIGVVVLMLRYKILLLGIPLILIGFTALKGGLRFTVFAIPMYAMGITYLMFLSTKFVSLFYKNKILNISIISILTALVLYPSIKHIQNYKVPTVFQKNEVGILDSLGKKISRKDYIVSWWDYGYPIRYYANAQTLIDGGKHSGSVNFPVSYALTKPLISAVNMLRLDVEYTEYKLKNPRANNNIANAIKDYKYKNYQELLKAMESKNFTTPISSRDIYLYLPFRMMSIFPTVALFSNLNLETGRRYPSDIFYISKSFKQIGQNMLDLGNGIKYDLSKNTISINNREHNLKYIVKTKYNSQGVLQVSKNISNPNSKLNLIYMMDYNVMILLEDDLYNSSYIQLFALEIFDKDLVKPVHLGPNVKVYKLKK